MSKEAGWQRILHDRIQAVSNQKAGKGAIDNDSNNNIILISQKWDEERMKLHLALHHRLSKFIIDIPQLPFKRAHRLLQNEPGFPLSARQSVPMAADGERKRKGGSNDATGKPREEKLVVKSHLE